jgi:hypothetical protein
MTKTLFLTNEYPPSTYGATGVHVDYFSRELASLIDADLRAFGNQLLDTPNLKADLLQIGPSLMQRARYTIPGMAPCRSHPADQTGL